MRPTKWNLDHALVVEQSTLKGGFIPERTECPFVTECEQKRAGRCWHSGDSHPVPYMCATATLISLRRKQKAEAA